MVNVWIDEVTPCLKNAETGDIVETEVVQVTRKSFLSKFNKKNHWYTNWENLLSDNEVYALVVRGTTEIQGMVALQYKDDYDAVFVSWMCSAPQNNKEITEEPKYIGVGGHLFAIAIDKSIEKGYGGVIIGFASNEKLLQHYCKTFGAFPVRILHPLHFALGEQSAKLVKEAYNYEWTDAKL